MPHVVIPVETFRRLTERAGSLNLSVDALVQQVLEQLAEDESLGSESRRSP